MSTLDEIKVLIVVTFALIGCVFGSFLIGLTVGMTIITAITIFVAAVEKINETTQS